MIRILVLIGALLLSGSAWAQGCGATNPNCIVPTAPPGTSDNRAASTAFVQIAVAAAGGITRSVSNSDGTLTVSPTTSAFVVSINLAHANTWTATQSFDAVGQALIINPPTGANQGLIISQTLSGSTAATSIGANQITITSDNVVAPIVPGAGIYGLLVAENVGASAKGSRNGVGGIVTLNVSAATGGDLIGGEFYGQASAPNIPGGTLFGGSMVAFAFNGATGYGAVIGLEVQGYIATGGASTQRSGLAVAGNGNLAASSSDAGIVYYSYTAAGAYQNGILFTNLVGGFAPLTTTATIIGSDGSANTVASFADFHTYTFTGNIMNFPNFIVTAGGIVAAGSNFQAAGHNGVSCPSGTFVAATAVFVGGVVTQCS